jgi:hypothetical protein
MHTEFMSRGARLARRPVDPTSKLFERDFSATLDRRSFDTKKGLRAIPLEHQPFG